MTNYQRAILHSGKPNLDATVAKQVRAAGRREARKMAKQAGR